MKLVFAVLFVFLSSTLLKAQTGTYTLKADISGILYLTQFQQDSLVPTKRRGKTGVLTEVMANAYIDFTLKNPRLLLRTGLGYSQKGMVLNKYSLGDVLFSFLPFTGPRPDTFRLQSIRYRYDYLNLPVGLLWRLTNNSQNWFQAQVGLQTNVGFCINRNVVVHFDKSIPPPTPAETEQIKQAYHANAAAVVVGLQPRLDLSARIYKNVGIFYSVQVYTLQFNSFHQRMARGGAGLGGGIGAYINL